MNKLIIEPGPSEAAALDPNRHSCKCNVCNHPERQAIEEDFLHWRSPNAISREYDIPRRTIYRHAHSLGLFVRRRGKVSSVLEHIIEQADHAKVTGQAIINAVRALSCLQDDGRWVEPVRHVVYRVERPPINREEQRAYQGALRDSDGRFAAMPPLGIQDPSQPEEILIDTQAIRNHANPMETKEEVKV